VARATVDADRRRDFGGDGVDSEEGAGVGVMGFFWGG
jgi:hypothetical protein